MKLLIFAVFILLQSEFVAYAQYGFEDEEDEEDSRNEQLISDLDSLQHRTEDLNHEMRKLRREAVFYEREDYEYELRKLQREAEDISLDAGSLGAHDAASSLDESAVQLQRARRSIDFEPRIFYIERQGELDSRLKRSAYATEDASSEIESKSNEIRSLIDD